MCIRCPLLRWKNAKLTQVGGSKVRNGDGVGMRDTYWGWVCVMKREEGLERRRWTSCQPESLHQPSKGSGPILPFCIIWSGLTCSLLLLPNVDSRERCVLWARWLSAGLEGAGPGGPRAAGCQWAVPWGWEWAPFQKGIWLGISMFETTKTLTQHHLGCENC